MGQETVCTLRFEGNVSEGKLLLETDFLLFRGAPRLQIPFADITKIEAKDGALRIRFSGGLAVFELGPTAPRWVEKILHPKGRGEKLGVKKGSQVAFEGAVDADFVTDIAPLAERATLTECELCFFGAVTKKDLARLSTVTKTLKQKAALWVVYPKGREEIREADVLAAGRAVGWTDIKVVRFSDTHTALKFVRPLARAK